MFLCLMVGSSGAAGQSSAPKGLEGDVEAGGEGVVFERRREREASRDKKGKRKAVKDKDWILKKKDVS